MMAGGRNLALGFVLGAIVAAGVAYALSPGESVTATPPAAAAKSAARDFASLPDWTGIWMGTGGNIFDPSKGGGNVNANPNARDYPPYKPEWEAAYNQFLDSVIKQGKFVDPLTVGYPGGMMRMMTPARGLQFILRPEQVWIVYERPDVRYIYTDGRPFPPKEELWPTFEGYSIGHWEDDTLVIETRSIRGSIPIDRTGAAFSDSATVHERIRKIDDRTQESQITIDDPVAFTQPWTVTKRYKKQPAGTWAWDYACAENNRNPISGSGKTLTLGPDGKPLDKKVD